MKPNRKLLGPAVPPVTTVWNHFSGWLSRRLKSNFLWMCFRAFATLIQQTAFLRCVCVDVQQTTWQTERWGRNRKDCRCVPLWEGRMRMSVSKKVKIYWINGLYLCARISLCEMQWIYLLMPGPQPILDLYRQVHTHTNRCGATLVLIMNRFYIIKASWLLMLNCGLRGAPQGPGSSTHSSALRGIYQQAGLLRLQCSPGTTPLPCWQ